MNNFFNNISDKLRTFMMGRNGADKLTLFAFIIAVLCSTLNAFMPSPVFSALSFAALFYGLYRFFSTDIDARRAENEKFEGFLEGFGRKKGQKGSQGQSPRDNGTSGSSSQNGGRVMTEDGKKLRFTCDECGQSLSVPKGRGTLKVTCPKCHHRMTVKS